MSVLAKCETRLPQANYDAARARAVAWLGDRYLLATPIKLLQGAAASAAAPRLVNDYFFASSRSIAAIRR
jgi:hypothetical protein